MVQMIHCQFLEDSVLPCYNLSLPRLQIQLDLEEVGLVWFMRMRESLCTSFSAKERHTKTYLKSHCSYRNCFYFLNCGLGIGAKLVNEKKGESVTLQHMLVAIPPGISIGLRRLTLFGLRLSNSCSTEPGCPHSAIPKLIWNCQRNVS